MTFDRTISTILLISFLVIAIPAALFFRKQPGPVLTPSEKELTTFKDQPIAISSPLPQSTFSGLASPVRAAPPIISEVTINAGKAASAPNAAALLSKKGPPRSLGSRPVVSMIYYAGSTRIALVDNHVVKEGTVLDGGLIVKIEDTRVLMRKAGKDIWLTTE